MKTKQGFGSLFSQSWSMVKSQPGAFILGPTLLLIAPFAIIFSAAAVYLTMSSNVSPLIVIAAALFVIPFFLIAASAFIGFAVKKAKGEYPRWSKDTFKSSTWLALAASLCVGLINGVITGLVSFVSFRSMTSSTDMMMAAIGQSSSGLNTATAISYVVSTIVGLVFIFVPYAASDTLSGQDLGSRLSNAFSVLRSNLGTTILVLLLSFVVVPLYLIPGVNGICYSMTVLLYANIYASSQNTPIRDVLGDGVNPVDEDGNPARTAFAFDLEEQAPSNARVSHSHRFC